MNKRFYKAVTVDQLDGAWRVLLDGMQLRTPGKLKLTLPSKTLAQAVAAEWEAQTETIDPSVMPLTRLVNVAVEQTPTRREDLIDEAKRYAQTDLVSYRAPEPRLLRERQDAGWDLWRDWAAERGVDLVVTDGLEALDHPTESLAAVERFAGGLDDLRLTLFVHLVAVFGSVVLAMAVMDGALDANTAFDLSRIDADYQIELWGEDELQADITAGLRHETRTLAQILEII